MDIATFRAAFPEFGTTPGAGAFTDARITFWIAVAGKFLTSDRWDNLLDYGTELFIAHHLTLDAARQAAAAVGGNVGQVEGPLTAKGIDKVSASFAPDKVVFENAGHWNLSTYGVQFYSLLRMIGAGGIELAPVFDVLFDSPQV